MIKAITGYENQGYRVSIRRSAPKDKEAIYSAYQDREFVRLFRSNTPRLSIEELEQDLANRENLDPAQAGFVEFIIEHPKKGAIGMMVLCDYSARHNRAEFLIGIFDKESRTSGLGVDATLLILDLAYNRFGLNKIYLYSYGYNHYAFRSGLSLGFKHEATLRQFHYSEVDKKFVDLRMSSLLLSEYRTSGRIAKLSRRLMGVDITQAPSTAQPLPMTDEQKQAVLKMIKDKFA